MQRVNRKQRSVLLERNSPGFHSYYFGRLSRAHVRAVDDMSDRVEISGGSRDIFMFCVSFDGFCL